MFNPDYPSTPYGWSAFQYHDPNEFQNNSFWYNGQGVANPFANNQPAQSPYQSDSRRYIGQQFAQNYGYTQQPSQLPATPAPAAPQNSLFGSQAAPTPIAPPSAGVGVTYSASPAPMFDSIYNNPTLGSTWDKTSTQVPTWNNQYTQPQPVPAPVINWTDSQKPQQPVGYGYGSVSGMNPGASVVPNFANTTSNWLNTVKQNFSL